MQLHSIVGSQSAMLGCLILATCTSNVTVTVDVVGSNGFGRRPGD